MLSSVAHNIKRTFTNCRKMTQPTPIDVITPTYDAVEKQWSGPPVDPAELERFFGHFMLDAVAAQPAEHIVQINDSNDYHMSGAEMHAKTLKFAQQLGSKLGLQWGDRICVAADQHDDLASLVIGAVLRGIVINALHTGYTMLEFKHFLDLVRPKVVICESRNVADVRQALRELALEETTLVTFGADARAEQVDLSVDDLVRGFNTEPATEVPPPRGHPTTELAFIMCSSGTTGLPKAINITHSMCYLSLSCSWPCLPNQPVFNASNLYWGTYLLGLSVLRWPGAQRIITATQPLTADYMLDMCERRSAADVLVAVPVIVAWLAIWRAHPERLARLRLRQIQTTGSVLPEHVLDELGRLMPEMRLNVAYGMSDVGGAISATGQCGLYTDDGGPMVAGSSGRICYGTTVRVVDEEGGRLGAGETGELCVRKACPFPGYLNAAEANKEAFDGEGFLRTGDIGHVTEEGVVFVVDRKKAFFKHRGFQIAPGELEQFIERHFGGSVVAAIVVGVPDEAVMSMPTAVVVRRPGREAEVTEEAVQQLIKDNFSDAKQLRGGVLFVDSLPRTSSNKVRRNEVQKMAEAFYHKK